MKWYKSSNTLTIDPIIAVVALKSKCLRHEVIAVWTHLMESAALNSIDNNGHMGSIDFEVIDYALELLPGHSQKIYTAFEAKDKIKSGCITNWRKHQIDSTNAERQRKFREKTKMPVMTVTDSNSYVTGNNAVTQEEKRREEKKEDILEKPKKYFFDSKLYSSLKQKQLEKDWALSADEKLFIKEYESNQVKQMRGK